MVVRSLSLPLSLISLIVLGCLLQERILVVKGNGIDNKGTADSKHRETVRVTQVHGYDAYSFDDDHYISTRDDYLQHQTEEDRMWLQYFHHLMQAQFFLNDLLVFYGCQGFDESAGVYNDHVDVDGNIASRLAENGTCIADPGADSDQSCLPPAAPAYSKLPTAETWMLFEEAYYEAVGMEAPQSPEPQTQQQQHQPIPPEDDPNHPKRLLWEAGRGLRIPHETRYDSTNPSLGRSIHTSTFLPAGTTVWRGSTTAAFTHDHTEEEMTVDDVTHFQIASYRRFIEYLYDQHVSSGRQTHNWACDALMWTYMSQHEEDADYPALCIAFDNGSLFNNSKGKLELDTLGGTPSEALDATPQTEFGLIGVAKGSKTPLKLPGAHCQSDALALMRDTQPGEGTYCIDASWPLAV